jgi:histidinol dehydrogenase
VSLADRARLEAIAKDRNSKAKHDMRARIVLATADGHGTSAIMRQAKASSYADTYTSILAQQGR